MGVMGIIPAYNEKNIKKIATESARFVDKLLVIDYGSDYPVKKGRKYLVLRNNQNKGKGYSLKRGFEYAVKGGYDAVITLDGDGEHEPSAIPVFLKKLESSDIVIGQRTNYRSLQRNILNRWAGFWLRLLLPSVKDTQCGFVALRTDLLKKLKITASGLSINLELLLEAFKNNAKFDFVSLGATQKKDTHVALKDYAKINNLFDRWVIKNYKDIKMPILKKYFILNAAVIGLIFGGVLEWILEMH